MTTVAACPTACDPDCELGAAGCHERHAYRPAHDPDDCEARRAVQAADQADDDWVCPPCRRSACHRCSDRNCRCCAGSPDDPALGGEVRSGA